MRNRALFVVLWRAGLRIGEALALRPCDVWPERGELAVLHGKGDRSRIVGFDPLTAGELERWLRRRQRILAGASSPAPAVARGRSPLFCTISSPGAGGPLAQSYVREALKAAAERAGIDKAVRPHGLRHTHAAELAHEGVPVHVIRRQLGHSSLATTATYIDHLAPREVVDAMRRRESGAVRARAPAPPNA